jgi:hypothetical protein
MIPSVDNELGNAASHELGGDSDDEEGATTHGNGNGGAGKME